MMRFVIVAFVCMGLIVAARAETGTASTYGHGKGRGDSPRQEVACGGRLNVKAMTAAHPTLPCGTRVRVTNLRNKKSVIVRINDRGPFVPGRIIDLAPRPARLLGISYGLAPVRVDVL